MNPLILVVEDNVGMLFNVKMILEFNNYEVITTTNGVEALRTLTELETTPDLIISDILMPKMNGYDLFKAVSENSRWNRIPFLFLTALSSPEEMRFGKMLGADDYITKPFKEEDLVASIAGKIARNKKIKSIIEKNNELITSLEIDAFPSLNKIEKKDILFLLMVWDDKNGPTLMTHYPSKVQLPISIESIGFQLFISVTSIYGQLNMHKPQGILLNIENIQKQGYIFFNSIKEKEAKGGERPFMLGVIAPKINYIISLKIREIFQDLSPLIKAGKEWEPRSYWERLSDIILNNILVRNFA